MNTGSEIGHSLTMATTFNKGIRVGGELQWNCRMVFQLHSCKVSSLVYIFYDFESKIQKQYLKVLLSRRNELTRRDVRLVTGLVMLYIGHLYIHRYIYEVSVSSNTYIYTDKWWQYINLKPAAKLHCRLIAQSGSWCNSNYCIYTDIHIQQLYINSIHLCTN